MKRIAIVGNPNSGKTTLFNALSGKNERVGNWAGVTVVKKEACLRRKYNTSFEDIILVDLPGAYGLDAYTNDELEATEFLKNEHIDAIINIVDAVHLERSLLLTTQLIESKIPVVIALNKLDVIKRKNNEIDIDKLSKLLGCDVYFTQATKRIGLQEVVNSVLNKVNLNQDEMRGNYEKRKKRHQRHRFTGREKGCGCK